MAWYTEKGKMQDVVLSTRVRFARNLSEYPFASRLSDTGANEIIEKVSAALPEYSCHRFGKNSEAKCRSYMEMHYVSPEFVSASHPRALITGENERVAIMVCEEDHLRIQSVVSGFDPESAFEYAGKADDILSEKLNIAFSEKYGYLTHCPTNLGAAMRVSAMLCLPALTMRRSIDRYAQAMNKMGITIRGIYGEGSRASGCLYQISNRGSLGIAESEIIKLISEVVKNIVEAERTARKSLFEANKLSMIDKTARTLGVLQNCHILSSEEFTECFSTIKLGVALEIVEGITDEKLSEVFIAVQPATLSLSSEGLADDETARDVARATLMRNMLKNVTVLH
ncbi:MAG: ATP--guanido phosphotransferase [Ruminococcaceae bacterium]|nr:ATP--guanido phosphotransferase [Oscillospiraceae bacterium]